MCLVQIEWIQEVGSRYQNVHMKNCEDSLSQCSVCKEPLFHRYFSPGGGLQRASPWLDFEDTRMGGTGRVAVVLLWCCPRKNSLWFKFSGSDMWQLRIEALEYLTEAC